MILTGFAVLLLSLGGSEGAHLHLVQAGRISVRQQIILRIPRATVPRGAASARAEPITWREGRSRRCVPARRIIGAGLLGPNSVDLVLRDNSRIRARLNRRCPALDFYRGFYVTATEDGQICADRDTIRSRAGRECEIDQFRLLQPVSR